MLLKGAAEDLGLHSSDLLASVKQKENWAEKLEKVQKEGMLEGSKEKIVPSSHTLS